MGVLAHVVPKTPPRKMCQKPHPEKNRFDWKSQGQIFQECQECVGCQECVECVECPKECQECVECVECNITGTFPGDHSRVIFNNSN